MRALGERQVDRVLGVDRQQRQGAQYLAQLGQGLVGALADAAHQDQAAGEEGDGHGPVARLGVGQDPGDDLLAHLVALLGVDLAHLALFDLGALLSQPALHVARDDHLLLAVIHDHQRVARLGAEAAEREGLFVVGAGLGVGHHLHFGVAKQLQVSGHVGRMHRHEAVAHALQRRHRAFGVIAQRLLQIVEIFDNQASGAAIERNILEKPTVHGVFLEKVAV